MDWRDDYVGHPHPESIYALSCISALTLTLYTKLSKVLLNLAASQVNRLMLNLSLHIGWVSRGALGKHTQYSLHDSDSSLIYVVGRTSRQWMYSVAIKARLTEAWAGGNDTLEGARCTLVWSVFVVLALCGSLNWRYIWSFYR